MYKRQCQDSVTVTPVWLCVLPLWHCHVGGLSLGVTLVWYCGKLGTDWFYILKFVFLFNICSLHHMFPSFCFSATFFIEMWKRRTAEIEYDWDVADFEEEVNDAVYCCCF